MARIRSVHPGLASDEAFMTMSMAAKAAWSLLWTECDDSGVFEWKPIVLKARIFPAENLDFAAILAEYVELGCIRKFEHEGKPYGVVRNFGKFQRPKNPSCRYTLPDALRSFAGSATPARGECYASATEIGAQMKDEGGRRKEEEEINNSTIESEGRASADVIALEHRRADGTLIGHVVVERPPDPLAKFPSDCSIAYSPWADVARRSAPGRDVDLLASDFRKFCHGKDISFDRHGILKTFESFCRSHKVRGAA